jgi:hypothetical protein
VLGPLLVWEKGYSWIRSTTSSGNWRISNWRGPRRCPLESMPDSERSPHRGCTTTSRTVASSWKSAFAAVESSTRLLRTRCSRGRVASQQTWRGQLVRRNSPQPVRELPGFLQHGHPLNCWEDERESRREQIEYVGQEYGWCTFCQMATYPHKWRMPGKSGHWLYLCLCEACWLRICGG